MPPTERALSHIVLIVDDVPENLSLLHDALDEAGHTVLVATNGEAALQRARQSLPEVILLDALMPGMDGFEVARRLKADFATQHIPIVFMTGLTETEHIVAAFAAGGADYVTKPIRPAEVIARIAAHVSNARQMRQARSALDAFGQATVAVRAADSRIVWQTPLARVLLSRWPGLPCRQHKNFRVRPCVCAFFILTAGNYWHYETTGLTARLCRAIPHFLGSGNGTRGGPCCPFCPCSRRRTVNGFDDRTGVRTGHRDGGRNIARQSCTASTRRVAPKYGGYCLG